jgi:hypothetical protein
VRARPYILIVGTGGVIAPHRSLSWGREGCHTNEDLATSISPPFQQPPLGGEGSWQGHQSRGTLVAPMYEPIIGALLGLRASAVGLGEGDGSSSTLVAVGVVLGVLGLLLLAYVTFVFCRARSESRAFDEMEEALIDDKGAASPRNGRRNDGGGGRGGSGGSARASDANDQRRPHGGGQSGGSGQWGMGTDMSASQSSSQGAGTEKSDLGLPVRYQLEVGPEPEFDEQTGAPMNAAARKKFGKDWQRKGRTSTRAGKTGQSGGGRQSFGRQLPYSELELATDGFDAKRLLGKGGSCLVYRGRVCEQPVAQVRPWEGLRR